MENSSTLIDTGRISNNANDHSNPLIAPGSNNRSNILDAKVASFDNSAIIPREFLGSRSVAQVIENEVIHQKGEESFFVADMGEVVRQHLKWKKLLPRIQPFYAIKCNPDIMVVRALHSLGCGFDCASRPELEMALSVGASPSNIIYANPCKQATHLRFAKDINCPLMTFDNSDELVKIHSLFPDAKLVLRILTDDSKSRCQLGLKFGASLNDTNGLIKQARDLGLDLVGVSFHVGSGCEDPSAFGDAVKRARKVFDQAAEHGYSLSILDVGGGFPGSNVNTGKITFESVAKILGPAVDTLFPDPAIRVISEPGRYYVSNAFTLAVQVTSRRVIPTDGNKSIMYYLNDGIYGSFNNVIFDHAIVSPKILLRKNAEKGESLFRSSLWGPTCDSVDCMAKELLLPELDIGDWLQFDAMGAYTVSSASTFNGFKKSKILYTSTFGADI